jgi:hypothetical protein
MLLKPREWLGYTIHMNDEFPQSDRAIDLFAESTIPLADTFGSSSDVESAPRTSVVVVGPRVEQNRLLDVLDLLAQAEFPVHFLLASDKSEYRKTILIGAYNLDRESVAPFTNQLSAELRAESFTSEELAQLIRRASTVIPMTSR